MQYSRFIPYLNIVNHMIYYFPRGERLSLLSAVPYVTGHTPPKVKQEDGGGSYYSMCWPVVCAREGRDDRQRPADDIRSPDSFRHCNAETERGGGGGHDYRCTNNFHSVV